MINTEKLQDLVESPQVSVRSPQSREFLAALSVQELLKLRQDVMAALPAATLAEMNLEEEVIMLFLSSKALMNDVLADVEVAPNQKAQVANSCSANLNQLVKMQLELYTSERIKAIELALIRLMKGMPEAQQTQFFTEYEQVYAGMQPKRPLALPQPTNDVVMG